MEGSDGKELSNGKSSLLERALYWKELSTGKSSLLERALHCKELSIAKNSFSKSSPLQRAFY